MSNNCRERTSRCFHLRVLSGVADPSSSLPRVKPKETPNTHSESLFQIYFFFFFLVWLSWVFSYDTWWCAGSGAVVCGLSCCKASGILVPQPGIKHVSPGLQGGFLTTGPPGKSLRNTLAFLFEL